MSYLYDLYMFHKDVAIHLLIVYQQIVELGVLPLLPFFINNILIIYKSILNYKEMSPILFYVF